MFDKGFLAGSSRIGARHPQHMQAFKGAKLELTSQARHGYTNIQGLTITHRLKLLSKGTYLNTTMRLRLINIHKLERVGDKTNEI